jgi:hypothetical protein
MLHTIDNHLPEMHNIANLHAVIYTSLSSFLYVIEAKH